MKKINHLFRNYGVVVYLVFFFVSSMIEMSIVKDAPVISMILTLVLVFTVTSIFFVIDMKKINKENEAKLNEAKERLKADYARVYIRKLDSISEE